MTCYQRKLVGKEIEHHEALRKVQKVELLCSALSMSMG